MYDEYNDEYGEMAILGCCQCFCCPSWVCWCCDVLGDEVVVILFIYLINKIGQEMVVSSVPSLGTMLSQSISTHPSIQLFNKAFQYIPSTHLLNSPTQPTHTTHPHNSPFQPILPPAPSPYPPPPHPLTH